MTIRCEIEGQVAEVVMHHPPVNAITVADTWKIHDTFKELVLRTSTHCLMGAEFRRRLTGEFGLLFEQLEHAISPGLLDKIEQKLGYPETCPYGRPIYRSNEVGIRSEASGTMRLSEARAGLDYTVTRIPDEDYPLLRYLVKNEILPGQRVSVEDIASYRGVVDLRRNGNQVSLGMDVAARIRVMPIP